MDASGWVAVVGREDQYHDQATALFSDTLTERRRMVTTNLVVAEAYTVILRRFGRRVAMQFLDLMQRSPRTERISSTPELETEAESILLQYDDQDFSYTDAVSFAVMRQRGIAEAFSFDHHFATAGFAVVPRP